MIHAPKVLPQIDSRFQLPAWAKRTTFAQSEADAAYLAGAALLSLDRIMRAEPVWGGVWRQRLALQCAGVAVRLSGRREGEPELRDAWVLRRAGDELGPAGNVYAAWKQLAGPRATLTTDLLKETTTLLGLRWIDDLEALLGWMDAARQETLAPPVAMARVMKRIQMFGKPYELLAWWTADQMLQTMMNWPAAMPISMAQRYSAHFRFESSQKRMTTDDAGFARALCLALVDGTVDALRLASDLERHASHLLATAPKLRAKGAGDVLDLLLNEDAVSGSLTTQRLSRFASRRLFERLLSLGAVRELSGRHHFRVFGL